MAVVAAPPKTLAAIPRARDDAGMPPPWILIVLAAVNLLTFALFGFDKLRARRERARMPEGMLLSWAFLGGFVGAWLGINMFQHKNRQTAFKLKLLAVTILNPVWLLVYYYGWVAEPAAGG